MLIETITDNKTNTWGNTPNVNRSANFCLLNNTKMITFFFFHYPHVTSSCAAYFLLKMQMFFYIKLLGKRNLIYYVSTRDNKYLSIFHDTSWGICVFPSDGRGLTKKLPHILGNHHKLGDSVLQSPTDHTRSTSAYSLVTGSIFSQGLIL